MLRKASPPLSKPATALPAASRQRVSLAVRLVAPPYLLLTLGAVLHALLGARPGGLLPFYARLAYGWWVASTFALVQIGLGRTILLRLPLRGWAPRPSARVILWAALGACASYALLLVLALLKSLNHGGGWIYFALTLPPAIWGLIPLLKASSLGGRNDWILHHRNPGFRALLWSAGAIGILCLLPILAQTLLPNSDWDGAMYHLPNAQHFLKGEVAEVFPLNYCMDDPGAAHLFYALALSLGAEGAIIPLSFLASAALVAAVYAFGAHWWGRAGGVWAALILASMNLVWEVGVTPKIDSFASLFFVLGCGLLVECLAGEATAAAPCILAGLMLGAAAGVKHTALVLAVALMPLLLLATLARLRGVSWRARAGVALLASAACLFPSAFWYARNAVRLRDPLYPHLHGMVYRDDDGRTVRFDDAYSRFLASHPLPADADQAIRGSVFAFSVTSPDSHPPASLLNLADVVVRPDRYETRPLHRISPLLLLFLLVPAFCRNRAGVALFAIGLGSFVVLALQTNTSRHAMPPLVLFAVGAGAVLASITWQPGPRRRRRSHRRRRSRQRLGRNEKARADRRRRVPLRQRRRDPVAQPRRL